MGTDPPSPRWRLEDIGFAPHTAPQASRPERREREKVAPFLPPRTEQRHCLLDHSAHLPFSLCFQNRRDMHKARRRTAAIDGKSLLIEGREYELARYRGEKAQGAVRRGRSGSRVEQNMSVWLPSSCRT